MSTELNVRRPINSRRIVLGGRSSVTSTACDRRLCCDCIALADNLRSCGRMRSSPRSGGEGSPRVLSTEPDTLRWNSDGYSCLPPPMEKPAASTFSESSSESESRTTGSSMAINEARNDECILTLDPEDECVAVDDIVDELSRRRECEDGSRDADPMLPRSSRGESRFLRENEALNRSYNSRSAGGVTGGGDEGSRSASLVGSGSECMRATDGRDLGAPIKSP